MLRVALLCCGPSVRVTWPPERAGDWWAVVAVNRAAGLFAHSHIAFIDKRQEFAADPAVHISMPELRRFAPETWGDGSKSRYTGPCVLEAIHRGCLGDAPCLVRVFGHDATDGPGVGDPSSKRQRGRWEKEAPLWDAAAACGATEFVPAN